LAARSAEPINAAKEKTKAKTYKYEFQWKLEGTYDIEATSRQAAVDIFDEQVSLGMLVVDIDGMEAPIIVESNLKGKLLREFTPEDVTDLQDRIVKQ
jgi:hypothetical protein